MSESFKTSCQKIVKKLSKKLSKSCQKVVTKSCQKVVKKFVQFLKKGLKMEEAEKIRLAEGDVPISI
jgi:mRNA-degrading endonuclease RelE of RelBE toxin-antitoxin system